MIEAEGHNPAWVMDLAFAEGLQFPQLPNASPDPILIVDSMHSICYVNPAWENLSGHTFKEVQDQDHRLLKLDKTPKKISAQLWRTLARGHSYTTDHIVGLKKDGTEYYANSTFFPIKSRGHGEFYVQIMRDITAQVNYRRQLEESEKKYRALMEQASDMIMLYDKDSNILDVNEKTCEMLGYTKAELLSMNARNLLVNEDVEATRQAMRDNRRGKTVVIERTVRRKDGSIFYVESSRKLIDKSTIQAIMRNITWRKEQEDYKDALISIASHELKTPMTSLHAFAQLLEKRLEGNDNAYLAEQVRAQSAKIVTLIDELLNVGRIQSGKLELHLQPIDIYALIRKIVTEYQYIVQSHTIIQQGQIDNVLVADASRIEQVIINLVTNAVKYSPGSNKVIIKTGRTQKYAKIAIQDFGIGIAKAEQRYVFQRFYRTRESHEEKESGLGLGLYISSEIIKRHGGKMWVKSQPGQGSTFFFTLPMATTVAGSK